MTSECENLVPLVVIIHIASQYPGILIIYATFLGAFKFFKFYLFVYFCIALHST